MQPNGVCMYILDANNVWRPWKGVTTGFGGVTLFAPDGVAIDTPTGTFNGIGTAKILATAALNYGLNAVAGSWDRIQSFAGNADALAAPVVGLLGGVNFNLGFNGTTYDRVRSFAGDADALAAPTLGLFGNANFPRGFNGATFDRLRSFAGNADAVVAPTLGLLGNASFNVGFNGTTYDRLRTGSAANLSAATAPASSLITSPGEWAIQHQPAANTIATITRAAGAAGVRHICRSITATLTDPTGLITASFILNLRDGATGAGTILWSARFCVVASIAQVGSIQLAGLNIIGSAATAMTLEFVVAPGANAFQTVALSGFDVS